MKTLKMRSWRAFILLVLLLFLFFYNFSIVQKERFLRQDDALILALAPVDPRSLMQGDYMILRFAIENDIERAWRQEHPQRPLPRKGRVVVTESSGEHIFMRLDDGEELGQDERFLQYTLDNSRMKIGGGAFFFQEGLAPLYNYARYARVSADTDGKAIISGLLDGDKRPLSKKRWDGEWRRMMDD